LIRASYRILASGILGLALAAPAWAVEAPALSVEAVRSTGYRVRVPTGEPEVVRGDVLGVALVEVVLPGAEPSAPSPGLPPLPARTVLLRVPWGVRALVTSTPGSARSLGVLRPAPMAHLLTDPRARARVAAGALERAVRETSSSAALRADFGAPLHSVAETAAAGERILAVTVRPVSWNPMTGEARVVDDVTLTVRWDAPVDPVPDVPRGARRATRATLAPSSAVGPEYALRSPLASARTAAASPLRVDTSRPWVGLGVTRPGLYQIGAADLAAAGVSANLIDPTTVRLFRATPGDLPESVDVDLGPDSLRECAITVTGAGDGTLDAADRIFFYATGATGFGPDLALGKGPEYEEAEHSDVETLWLTWGPGPWGAAPSRMTQRDASPITSGAPLHSVVTHRVHFETNGSRTST
jgi:hypothetical protein